MIRKCFLIVAALVMAGVCAARGGSFEVGNGTFLLNGEPVVVKAAELHYPRIPQPYWEHRIKMCKALGMNAVCLYVFWNIHEPKPGEFDFSGQNDVAEFCRLCQKNGMYVIVRPGPYVCAEWEMGGLPWWLLKKKDIRLREQDPYFMERVRLFEREVGKQLAALTIDKGGPIIMVQVENEYGSYGTDKAYVSEIRDIVRASGFDKVTLFQCDWSSNFENNGLDDLVWTMNFGTGANIDEQFRRLGELRPNAPKMCSEFWSGWFDKWGASHETRTADDMVAGIDEMLGKGISFSLYMTHGGTSFGHWAGANSPGFAPDVTSYDYDAPISEWGAATEKYHLLRNTLQKYSSTKLPAIPKAPMPIIAFPEVRLEKTADFEVESTTQSHDILTMEEMDMGWGLISYETTMPAIAESSILTINDPHDYAQVWLDGKLMGRIDRVRNEKAVGLPPVRQGQKLRILVEAMGRINFGRAIKDYKGITENVVVTATVGGNDVTYALKNWTISTIREKGNYSGTFTLSKVGDTFINMERWGKGQLFVNGHAIGRYWSIGPQQTLYVPGCWLKKGVNTVEVLEVTEPTEPVLWGQATPELNKLNLNQSNRHDNPGNRPKLKEMTPVFEGQLAPGNGWQTVSLNALTKGRYIAIEIADTHDSGDMAAIAELYALNRKGERLSREPWLARYANSEAEDGNHTADKVFDLQESTYWQSEPGAACPHLLVIDMGGNHTLSAIQLLPRAEQNAPHSPRTVRVFVYQ